MHALFYTGDSQMDYRDAPLPEAAAGEVLLKIRYCGICGSDRHAYHGLDPRRVPPLILGHEAVGEDEDGKLHIINPLINCGSCAYCIGGRANLCPQRELIGMKRAGAFAEYLAMPRTNLLPLPAALSAEEAALTEPAACAWRLVNLAAQRLPFAPPQARALVIGAGAIGILSALALDICGCRHLFITDANPQRCAAAEELGIGALAMDEVKPDSYDIVVDAVGAPATRALSCEVAAAGGVIAHIGLQDGGEGLDARRLTLQEINFTGSYTYTPAEFAATVQLLADGAFGEVMRFCQLRPLSDGAAAFADLDAGTPHAKIILQP